MREAEHLASLPVVLTVVLTYPLIPSKLGHGWGWGWVCVCRDDGGGGGGGVLIPLGEQKGGEVWV